MVNTHTLRRIFQILLAFLTSSFRYTLVKPGKKFGLDWRSVAGEELGGEVAKFVANQEMLQIPMSGCKPRAVANHEWLLIPKRGCKPQEVANSHEQWQTTSGCKPRAVANSHKRLLISRVSATASGCWHSSWQGFLKVGICIDDEAWEKDWYHWVSVYKCYLLSCEADPLSLLLTSV